MGRDAAGVGNCDGIRGGIAREAAVSLHERARRDNCRFRTGCAAAGSGMKGSGADLVGCFAPHESSATTAYGVYIIESPAA